MKNKYRIISVLCILTLISTFMTGCEKNKPEENTNGLYVYYIDSEEGCLVKDIVSLDKDVDTSTRNIAKYYIEAMMNPKDKTRISVINNNVKILDFSVSENILTVNFHNAYYNQSEKEELFFRAAFVLTLTQIEGIDYIGININGQPLLSNNNASTLLKASDFADISGGTNLENTTTDVNLFYANEKGDKLKCIKKSIKYDGSTTLEKFIVEELIAGPRQKGYYQSLPNDINVLDAFTRNGTCYVYLDIKIDSSILAVSEEVMVYSIVNSLSELSYIRKVQIIIDGNSEKMLRGKYDLDMEFSRNLDIVEEEKESQSE